MAFDGITTYAVLRELNQKLLGGRIDKIYQPDADEIILGVRSLGSNCRLLLTAQARCPRIHITDQRPENPLSPPMFCMLLRKHIAGGKIISMAQYHMDRIVELTVEAVNEMGDLVQKRLILEMMGKHSNLFLIDEHGVIIDAIHHVTAQMSSVRPVMPGMLYELPTHNAKVNPLTISSYEACAEALRTQPGPVQKSIYLSMNGISPFMAREILFRAGVDDKSHLDNLTPEELEAIYHAFSQVFAEMVEGRNEYTIYLDGDVMKEFTVLPSQLMEGANSLSYSTISELLDVFYKKQDVHNKIQQKSQDLHKLISNNLDRARRKAALQEKQMEDTKDREEDRIAGELITANIYQLKKGMTTVELVNFYEEDMPLVTIRLDSTLTPAQNAQKYFNRYNKAKRTEAALTEQLQSTYEEIEYLESIETSLALSNQERDLENLRMELHEAGYIRRMRKVTKNLSASKPMSFTTSEGVKILIGKNNIQNDQLTFKTASPYDLWLHVKDIPGSHTILFVSGLTEGEDYTEKSILEAAKLAASFSKAANGSNVPVDYTLRRYVKKPSGSKPGFVIYTHQQTLYVTPDGPAAV